jgi:hypothetical protein
MGRFLTTDPKSGSAKAERPQTWNRYAYAGNNPVNSIDPRGLNQDECQIPTTGDLIPDCLSGGGGSNGPCFIDPFYPVPDPYCADFILALPVPGKRASPPKKQIFSGIKMTNDCYDRSAEAFALGGGAAVRRVTYQPVDQDGNPYLGTVTVNELNVVTKGKAKSINTSWTVSLGGTFDDYISSGSGQSEFEEDQLFFGSAGGVSNIPLKVIWYWGESRGGNHAYATPNSVTINNTRTVNKDGTPHYCDESPDKWVH